MPTLSRFTNADLPVSFEHQIRDFIRIHWFDIFQYNIHARALPDEWNPVYFVVGDEPALYSHAGVSSQSVECNGQLYSCGGLGSVFTYPAFRNRGYGSQVVEAATEYLQASSFDIAMLWTDDDKEKFYGRWGWEHHPSFRTVAGDKNAPELWDAFMMILPLSEKAKGRLADFENEAIYVGEYGW